MAHHPWAAGTNPVALVFIFFSCGEDFPRSSLGPGWLELPIFDCRLPRRGGLMDIGRSCHTAFSIVNRQLKPGLRLRPKAPLCPCPRLLIFNPIEVRPSPQFILAEATEPTLAATLDSRLRVDLSRRHV